MTGPGASTHHWLGWSLAAVTAVILVVLLVISLATGAGASDIGFLLVPTSFLVVGVAVSTRQPEHVEGRLLLLTALAWAASLAVPFDGSWVVPVGLMTTHLLLRFPDGDLPSPHWRWFSGGCTVLIAVLAVLVTTGSQVTAQGASNPYYVSWTARFSVLLALLPVSMVVSAGSLVVRYRRAGAVARLQLRWLAYAAACVVVLYAITLATSLAYDAHAHIDGTQSNWFETHYPAWLLALQMSAAMSFTLIPAAFAVAILRYRLYDIDRIISRTTSYVLLTGLLLATYALVVTVVTRLLPTSSNLAVAAATLAAVALARRAIRPLQAAVDRRFNRARYDAQHTVEGFGRHLRHEVDASAVVGELCTVVGRTLEPESVSLWLRSTT